jgi:hypothetical protein
LYSNNLLALPDNTVSEVRSSVFKGGNENENEQKIISFSFGAGDGFRLRSAGDGNE